MCTLCTSKKERKKKKRTNQYGFIGTLPQDRGVETHGPQDRRLPDQRRGSNPEPVLLLFWFWRAGAWTDAGWRCHVQCLEKESEALSMDKQNNYHLLFCLKKICKTHKSIKSNTSEHNWSHFKISFTSWSCLGLDEIWGSKWAGCETGRVGGMYLVGWGPVQVTTVANLAI